jgi:hypothetical protein
MVAEKKHKCMTSQFCRSEVCTGLWVKTKAWAGLVSCGGPQENHFLAFSGF